MTRLNRSVRRCHIGFVVGFALLGTDAVGAQARACGVERWPVKILADHDRALIDTVRYATAVSELSDIPIPEIPYPHDRRIAPFELRIYRLRAVVRQIIPESDGDWHIVIGDSEDSSLTMIAEVPDSSCAIGTGFEATYANVRRLLRTFPRNAIIEFEGVGFFDFIHNQRGRAPNGFELHPILAVRLIAVPSSSANHIALRRP